MPSDLIKKLRTCSTQERRSVAIALAETGTDEAITELIRMVEARRRSWFSWYDIEDQLIGIEALGETENERALQYLQRLYATVDTSGRTETIVTGGGSEPRDDDVYEIEFEVHTYPLARGILADMLAYEKPVSVSEEYHGGLSKDEWPHWADRTAPEQKKSHQVLTGAIQRLKKQTGNGVG